MNLRIFPPEEIIDGTVTLPYSKSFVNRLMIIDALAGTPLPSLDITLAGTDIVTLRNALDAPADALSVDVADCGTAMRFLTALMAATPDRNVTITGTPRMCERPIAPLVDALRGLGAKIAYAGREGYPPLRITGTRLNGGEITVDASVSSQFVSALMLIAPTMARGLRINLVGEVKSRPYIGLTAEIMRARGADVEVDRDLVTIAPGQYNSEPLHIERDWSALAFWAELAAVSAGFIGIDDINPGSAQPDRAAIEIFGNLGAGVAADDYDDDDDDDDDDGCGTFGAKGDVAMQLCGSPEVSPRYVHDFSANPDLVQAAMVACALVGVPFSFSGLESLRIKETDRIEALANELLKLGVAVEISEPATMSWDGHRHPVSELPRFETYGDHRMAMALAPVAFFVPGTVVCGAECVSKSYPRFWEELKRLGFTLTDGDQPYSPGAEEGCE